MGAAGFFFSSADLKGGRICSADLKGVADLRGSSYFNRVFQGVSSLLQILIQWASHFQCVLAWISDWFLISRLLFQGVLMLGAEYGRLF